MNRRHYIKSLSRLIAAGIIIPSELSALNFSSSIDFSGLKASDFGNDFNWGISTAAYQIEGAYISDEKIPSIWDSFSKKKRKIKDHSNGNIACDFYNNYIQDIGLLKQLHIKNFRLSIAWTRILKTDDTVNSKGILFYHHVIDECLKNDITPWITLYHWDLPAHLERKGGWKNRKTVNSFLNFTDIVTKEYGSKVKNWMVLNEPMAFTGVGYLLGIHAPGKRGMKNFLPAAYHAALANAEGGRLVRKNIPAANIGTTFSCSYLTPASDSEKDVRATKKMDAFMNRFFIEPLIGKGFPINDLPWLNQIYKFKREGDDLSFDFDFWGIQNYTREVVKHIGAIPYIHGKLVRASKRKVAYTQMNWEVYPESIYQMLHKFSAYDKNKKLIITENGAAFNDEITDGIINDVDRIRYLESYLKQVLKAKQEGVNVNGYFIWTLLDNFEWAEGYRPKFGLVHIDFKTQKRTVKNSGLWYKEFLCK